MESEPPVAFFRFPVEFVVNVDEAPELREWAEKVARVCERAFPMINDELMSPGFMPKPVIPLELRNDRGRHLPDDEDTYAVATVIAGRIMASATYFQEHPEDVGALVVGTVFVVQRYRSGKNPGWLTTGIADYLRFYKFEPGSLRRIDPDREKYDSNSKAAAAFLGYLVGKYDRQLVRKLNQVMREGQYREEVFQTLTGKSLPELGEEWLASLRRGPGS